ncbi:MAG: DNA repair protein RecN [Muribaculaceae bacterium]|nr:DNA repair protein RecN [Muribaculaceae bacterium]
MIENLHISNYALIDKVDISFHPGFNIITGETGAGKSIMLGALSLLLGGRADTKAVRDPKVKSVIEASFSVKGYGSLEAVCTENYIDWDPEQIILRREIAPGGRSRAFVNDTPVTVAVLQEIALQLVDIHSQHQNLLLVSPPYQLRVIDSLAGNGERLQKFVEAYSRYRHAVKQYQITRRKIEQARDEEEYLRYQFQQLDEARLEAGEQDNLEREREVMINMADIKESLTRLLDALGDGDENVVTLLKTASDEADSLTDLLEDTEGITERLQVLRVECQDIYQTFADADRQLSSDPRELEAVEQRLQEIYDLERRHKVDTVEALIEIRDNMEEKLRSIDLGDQSLHTLERNAKRAKKEALDLAREISAVRKETAVEFARLLRERALPLGMKNLQVEVSVKETELTATGIDYIEFLFAFNKNQQPMPIGNTASGGEISRLMLSIKSIVADKMQLPSIVFDEVDTGVSGDVANRMGEMMKDISKNIQVIAITHLPQVAAQGNTHYKVYKEDTDTSTVTRVKELGDAERIDELAMMLSGSAINDAARANARSLLGL